jgi:predicted ATPase
MIKSLALTNFKSIGRTLIESDEGIKEGKLDFAPLTIFCGKNSSGKSTVLQSILLLAQTLQNNNPKETLVLNGPMIKLGGVDDIKSEFQRAKNISIDLDIFIPEQYQNVNSTFKYREKYLPEIKIDCKKEKIYLEELNENYEYYLSNNLDIIKKIIYLETGLNINLEMENWKLNQDLSKNVKEIMNKYKVIYSMTTKKKNDIQYIWINKCVEDKCLILVFTIINDTILSDDVVEQSLKNPNIMSGNIGKKNNKRYNQNTKLFLSFSNKNINDISNIIPIIKQFHFKDEYMINCAPYSVSFSASYNAILKKNIVTQDIDFERFILKLDDVPKIMIDAQELIGLRMDHFLPKEIVYVINKKEIMSDTIIKAIINELIKLFLNKEYYFSDQFIKSYNVLIHGLMSEYNNENFNKIFETSNILIPENININDEKIFKKHVKKLLIGIKKIKLMLSDYILATKKNDNKGIDHEIEINNYYFLTDSLGTYIQDSISNIKGYFQENIIYIGPLREEPHLQYEGYIENIKNIGTKGENCAGVLYQNKNKIIRNIAPKNIVEKKQIIDIKFCTLLDSTNEWLQYIGVADSVITSFNGRYGYELKIKSIDKVKNKDLTNVGVGVSQVLPIILACLLAPEESTIIIEQPELHLHPAMQSKLTDFFVSMILCKKQLVIETHSEYIINRLRLRAINWSTEKPINELINIYFTENIKEDKNNYKKGNTLFRPIKINEYGAISDWPEGFFDESSESADEIFNAASIKWKQKQEKNND